ncbi:Tex family protein [Rothia nasimurium]|uniref:Tex family protein n=1 Tax=Rothia nasimurium TaxID=85336 RepID=UPI001F25EA6E|nr:Tex family protein [Rothia nasimurium]
MTHAGSAENQAQGLPPIEERIASELGVSTQRVDAAVRLLDEGATVPFIARYRKEATGGLDDAQLRTLAERLRYLRDLEDRRAAVLNTLHERALLTDELAAALALAPTKNELEALYAPHKTKRKTLAYLAREAGLESLVEDLLEVPFAPTTDIADAYVEPALADAEPGTVEATVASVENALDGARAILIEQAMTDPALADTLRQRFMRRGVITSRLIPGQQEAGAKFSDYFEFNEEIRKIPSHRVLALLRAEKEGAVKVTLDVDVLPPAKTGLKGGAREAAEILAEEYERERSWYERTVAEALGIGAQVLNMVSDESMVVGWQAKTVRTAWRQRLLPRLATETRTVLFEQAEKDAITVFSSNLRDVLLAAPAGSRPTLGLDPGLRTGVKVAAVGATGQVLATTAIYPHAPRNQWEDSLATLEDLVISHGIELIAIGNGTASRETDKLAGDLLKRLAARGVRGVQKIVVSEAGASVYSASELASTELPGLDVSLRGAVSIARRLQDPLAELVKIDPQSIGVGQYQHDVSPAALTRALDGVVEDCVNAVGVLVNSASPALLARVAGFNRTVADNIVTYRTEHGPFTRRTDLLKVPRLGPKAYEQAAGFVRITDGPEPLDASGVHPESYDLARQIVTAAGGFTGNRVSAEALAALTPADFVTETHGLPTVTDIIAELSAPGRDPRPTFRTARFEEGIETISDLTPGMILEGTVSNVAAFGAFVDIGVHQDGLVHVSQMSRDFVSDPHAIVKSGDIVQVRVVEADPARKRISLSLLLEEPEPKAARKAGGRRRR